MEAAVFNEEKNPFEELTDDQIITKLNDGVFMEEFAHGENWLLFRESLERLARKTEHLLLKIDPNKDATGIIESQVIIKFCRNILPGIVNSIRQEGRLAFDETKRRKINVRDKT